MKTMYFADKSLHLVLQTDGIYNHDVIIKSVNIQVIPIGEKNLHTFLVVSDTDEPSFEVQADIILVLIENLYRNENRSYFFILLHLTVGE